MKTLSKEAYRAVIYFIQTEARELERAICNKNTHDIIKALARFQNEDGGFGHGIEPDIRLPHSSPIATSVALQTLCTIDHNQEARKMIEKAVHYLEQTYIKERPGWLAVPPEVNDYPHAFWWTVHENGQTWIDASWGNPSAELAGYLYSYKNMVRSLDISSLIDHALHHFSQKESFESEHEIYCYQRFFHMHPQFYKEDMQKQMEKAVEDKLERDPEEWKNYVPYPLKFKPSPIAGVEIDQGSVEQNLDYFVDKLEQQPFISPTWEWNRDEEQWPEAKKEWQGILTLEVLNYLDNYERLPS